MEEINTLGCIQTTEDGWIIDPETGYVYDPLTGMPYDPVTGQPIDLGLIGGGGSGGNQLELDCYNNFLNFIDYYRDKEDKPDEYYELLKYWECLLCVEKCRDCLLLPGIEEWMEENENQNGYVTPSRYIIRFCDLVIPDIPEEEEEEEELPDFPEIDLGTGVDDTWEDEEPAMTEIVADPMDVHEPVWWYHSDHLGSTTYITDLTGKPCQYIEYLPFGEVMVQQSTNNIFENSYKFNAKELDESTGYYYYGARYYDPGISIFLSVDPLAEKYSNTNPYVFVANNPIMFIDDDGRDYRVFFNSKTKTVTIKATYYAIKKDMASAQKATKFWNDQSGAFNYSIGKKDKSENYKVNFELSVVEVAVDAKMGERASLNKAMSQDKSGEANVYSIDNTGLETNTNGRTIGGNYVRVKDSQADADTGAHEVGHTLGLEHSIEGLMTPSSTEPNRSSNIGNKDVNNILQNSLQGNRGKGGKGTSINNTNFTQKELNKGKVQ